MPQPKEYKHYLRTYDGANWQYWYYVASTATVDCTTTITELDRAPEGWQEYEIIFERGFTYYGLFTSFTTPLKFLKDGAAILRHIKYTFGIEYKVELLVEQLDHSDWTYSTLFRGDIDMSKTQDEYDYLVVPIIEGGFVEKLKSRAETPYTYVLENHADVQWVEHDGIDMQALLKWTGVPATNGGGFPDLTYYDTEGTNIAFHFYSQVSNTLGLEKIIENSYGSSLDVDLTINYDVTFNVDAGAPNPAKFILRITVSDALNVTITDTDFFTAPSNTSLGGSNSYSGTATDTITVPGGAKLSVRYVAWTGVGYLTHPEFDVTTNNINAQVYFINRFETTYIPTLKASKVFSLLMNSISEDAITVTSTLLSTTLNDEHFLTSGDGVRGLSSSTFTTTFSDFFKWANSKFGCALYYDRTANTVYLEAKTTVFNGTMNPSYTITSVDDFKCIPFTEEAFTNLSIGSKNYDYDAKGIEPTEVTNGRDEWNLTSKYLSPFTRLSGAAKDYISPYRDDVHGIEQVRANLSGKELADASSDGEVFVLHCEAANSGSYTFPYGLLGTVNTRVLFRTAINATPGASYWQINNVFSPETAYNIFYSSARCVFRNGDWFRSLFKLNDADYFKYKGSGKVNTNGNQMSTEEGAVPTILNEDDDIGISSLCANDAVLFQPFIFEFNTREPVDLYNTINSNPFDYLRFTFKGNTYDGYILKATSKPSRRGETGFRLLATYDTDMTNLIR